MDLPPEWTKHAPELIGATTAALFLKGTPWPLRIALILPGFTAAYYSSAWIAAQSGMPEGVAGLLTGLFAMRAVMKVFETLDTFDAGRLLTRWVSKLLGISDTEPRP